MDPKGSMEEYQGVHRYSNTYEFITVELGGMRLGIKFILLYTILKTESLNPKIALETKRKDSNLLSHCDEIQESLTQLELFKNRVSVQKFMMVPSLNEVLSDSQLLSTLSKEIMDHLSQLNDEFRRCFPHLSPQHAGSAKKSLLCQVVDVLENA